MLLVTAVVKCSIVTRVTGPDLQIEAWVGHFECMKNSFIHSIAQAIRRLCLAQPACGAWYC